MSEQNPFGNLPMFGDIARLLSSQGPVNWDVARQLAGWVATDGQDEPNVEPLERMRFEELLRVAELRVADATGLETAPGAGLLRGAPVTRRDWASRTLTAYGPLLERLARALAAPSPDDEQPPEGERTEEEAAAGLLGDLGRMMSPVLLGVQAGSMVGHLARRAFGQYDLPLPRPVSNELLMVPANLDAFVEQWSIPAEDLRLWVCLREVTLHAVLRRPHVDTRLRALLDEYVGAFSFDPGALESSLGDFDPSDPSGLSAVLASTEALLGMLRTPAQEPVLRGIETLVVPIAGYVDHLLDTIGSSLIGSYGRLTEALRRRRVEESDGERFVNRILGLELGRAQYERGQAFVRGVVERAGEDGLRPLWGSERDLPTAAELDAPGLWLARIELPDQ